MNIPYRSRFLSFLCHGAIAACALYVLVFSLGHTDILSGRERALDSVTGMLDGSTPTPYVYRTLIPQTANLIASLTPESIQESVRQCVLDGIHAQRFQDFIHAAKWDTIPPHLTEPVYAYRVVIALLLMYASVFFYGEGLYHLVKYFFPQTIYMPLATTFFGLLLLLPQINHNFKLYDFATLAFSAWCLLLMLKQNWGMYLVCFALACINKETTLMQIVLFLLLYGHGKTPAQKTALALQCLIYVGATLLVRMLLIPQHGASFWFTPVTRIANSMEFFDTENILVYIAGLWLLFSRWRELPLALHKCMAIFGMFILLFWWFGNSREYRLFFDIYPALTVIAGYTLFKPLEKPSPA